jgi:hypothetical protein
LPGGYLEFVSDLRREFRGRASEKRKFSLLSVVKRAGLCLKKEPTLAGRTVVIEMTVSIL